MPVRLYQKLDSTLFPQEQRVGVYEQHRMYINTNALLFCTICLVVVSEKARNGSDSMPYAVNLNKVFYEIGIIYKVI